jgi:predicted alpha/beta-fold hydrolase
MPLVESTYPKPKFLWNAHLETIIPNIFRKVKNVFYQRERFFLKDNDFLDLDWLKNESKKLVIIAHGLEGNTKRGYIKGMAKFLHQKGLNVLAFNHRSCSEEMNLLPKFYHSGASDDLRELVNYVVEKEDFEEVFLVGFSLGGNVILKYLGEEKNYIHEKIKKAVVFSVPLHLSSCSEALRKSKNWIYAYKFKKSLFAKIRKKSRLMPQYIDKKHIAKVKNLKDFDDFYTAPLHNFKDAEDYYEKSSAIYFLHQIKIPTLIVNALNDPFLGHACFPFKLVQTLQNVYLETPQYGGHCGFSAQKDENGFYWSEHRCWEFLSY